MILTAEAVRRRVANIKGVSDDNETAHMLEDKLVADVLKAIARGQVEDPVTVAKEAIKVYRIKYDRWYA